MGPRIHVFMACRDSFHDLITHDMLQMPKDDAILLKLNLLLIINYLSEAGYFCAAG